jgi:predicted ATPase/class 3 adenylate cyclase
LRRTVTCANVVFGLKSARLALILRGWGVITELPTGTVTLLFTDVEGSTRLLERLGNRYVDVLDQHRQLLRAAFAQFNGREVGTEGDAFFVAFTKASEAVAAAVAGQRALAEHPWPDGAVLRVRMGTHTGEPILVGRDYAGLDVHRAARICSAGHGGQVLISQATRELLGQDLPCEVGLRDLGHHRLKDLTQPQRLFQLVIPDLPADFPPLRTLGVRAMNLPLQLTGFVGRRRELAEARTLLERPDVRLLTLTGPGGTGKTRLAVQVAAGLQEIVPDGVVFIALGSVGDPALVMSIIAHTLGIREAAGQSLLDSVKHAVDGQRLLLVLDNFEQVLAAAPSVIDLLAACRHLKILVTSRAALHVSGEHIYPVPPLSLPDRDHSKASDYVAASEAVMLFVQRARAVNPSFTLTDANAPVIAEICRRLDGLPLAIELAAARSNLPPQVLLSRLESRLQLLKGGARDLPARQQTLRATIDWSYALLEAGERTLLARLAIFTGGCTLEAAEVVCNLEGDLDVLTGLDALVDRSLLQFRDGPAGGARLLMLETIREYGLERLRERQETEAVARRHADHYMGLAEQAEFELMGPRQRAWYERLEADLDNLRTALAWFSAHRQLEGMARLAAPIVPFWISRSHAKEGLRWLDAALEHLSSLSRPALAKALFAKGNLLLELGGDHQEADTVLKHSLALFQESGDITWTVRTVSMLGWAASRAGDFDRSVVLRQQAVALTRNEGDQWNLAMALGNLGGSLLRVGDFARARAVYEEALALYQSAGEPEGIAFALWGLGMLALGERHHRRAASLLEEALVLARKLGHLPSVANWLADRGVVALHGTDYDEAAALFKESLSLAPQVEEELLIAQCLWGMAVVAAAKNQPIQAVRLWGAGAALGYALHLPAFAYHPLEEQVLAPTRELLGLAAFDAEWAKGHQMGRDDAIAYAMGQT